MPGRTRLWIGCIFASALAATGCLASVTQLRPQLAQALAPGSQLVVLWSEGFLQNTGTPVAQGFTGKFYVFPRGAATSTAIEGRLTICAFDDTGENGPAGRKVAADRTWQFDAQELETFLVKDAIGPCYTVWLPFGPPSSAERRCTLLACVTTPDGAQLISQPTLVTLPAIPERDQRDERDERDRGEE